MPNTKKPRKKIRSANVTHQKMKVQSKRGVPETNYGEIKKIASFSLTPTALSLFKEMSQELNISVSELLERHARLGAGLKTLLRQEVLLQKAFAKESEAIHKP